MIRFRRLSPVTSAAVLTLVAGMPRPVATQTIEELQRKLTERDEVIADLSRRVETLERRLERRDAARTKAASPPAGAEAVPRNEAAPPASTKTAEGVPPAPTPRDSAEPPPPVRPAPGQFNVDEAAVQRALERALVQTGVLLLDLGAAEIEPSFSYLHEERATAFSLGENNLPSGTHRRNRLQAGLTLRFGLPFSSQAEFYLPYVYEDQSQVFPGTAEDSRHASGLGDFSMTLRKALLREGDWQPDLTASIQWDSNTGVSRSGIDLGSGFNELSASLSAVKRIDPLAFVGELSYTTTFEKHTISPGDSFGVSVGTVLATSPDTSLRFLLNQNFTQTAEVNGQKVPGSSEVIGSFSFGGSIVLGPRALLDVSVDIGLTPSAPDYSVLVSLPIRFDLPIPSGL